jgi:hypothetical protein
MTGTAIDREVRAALAVDPSPEFLARVRTEIAAQPPAVTTWLTWKHAAAAVLAAIVAAAVVISRPQEKTGGTVATHADIRLTPDGSIEQPRETASAGNSAGSRTQLDQAPEARARAQRARSTSATGHSTQAVATNHLESDILVDRREARAVRLLIRGTRDGSLDLSAALQATTPTVMNLPPIADIVIAPLSIDPLTPSGEEGVRP